MPNWEKYLYRTEEGRLCFCDHCGKAWFLCPQCGNTPCVNPCTCGFDFFQGEEDTRRDTRSIDTYLRSKGCDFCPLAKLLYPRSADTKYCVALHDSRGGAKEDWEIPEFEAVKGPRLPQCPLRNGEVTVHRDWEEEEEEGP